MDKVYKIFDRYMQLNKYKYNKVAFLQDDMYFCKTFKAHAQGFRYICKDYDCLYAFDALENRVKVYEKKVADSKLY